MTLDEWTDTIATMTPRQREAVGIAIASGGDRKRLEAITASKRLAKAYSVWSLYPGHTPAH